MTALPIIFPDVELELTARLRADLATHGYPGMFVSNERQSQASAVQVRRDGGPTLDVVRELARVGVNVWAPTQQGATDLARTVCALIRAAADGEPIVKVVQTSGPSPVADATPRRYMTFEVWQRGTELNPA